MDSMAWERELIRKQFLSKDIQELLSRLPSANFEKNAKIAIEAREDGNEFFRQKKHTASDHKLILNFYSLSVAVAIDGSEEMGLALSNRSVLLLHLKKYKECILDIDKAFGIIESNILKIKLLCRKVECLVALDDLLESEVVYLKAQDILDGITENDTNKDNLAKLVAKAKLTMRNGVERYKRKDSIKKEAVDEFSKEILEKKEAGPFGSVAIAYSEKYGRHLVATKNIEPGKIVYVEKLCGSFPIENFVHVYCSHCLKEAWAGIPCKKCCWCIFCSEKCQKEAWEQYHDIECQITSYIRKVMCIMDMMNSIYQIGLRIVIKGIKQAGSIKNLKAELKSIDDCKDDPLKGFTTDGKFDTSQFKSIYSLSHNQISDNESYLFALVVTTYLACDVKYNSSLLGTKLEFQTLTHLAINEDVLYVGALLLKIAEICRLNASQILTDSDCAEQKDSDSHMVQEGRGFGLGVLSGLINNSCIPNVKRCYADNCDMIIYSTEPIKKNSQIFTTYFSPFYTQTDGIGNRRTFLKEKFYFTCDCIACEQNWPDWISSEYRYKKHPPEEMQFALEYKVEEIREYISNGSTSIKSDKELLSSLNKAIEVAFERFSQPSWIICELMVLLQVAFNKFYGYKGPAFKDCK